MGGDLGVEVAAALAGGAHVAQEEVEDGLVELAGLEELDGRDDDALLDQLLGDGHGAGGDAADVGVVSSGGEEADEGRKMEGAMVEDEDRRRRGRPW